MAIWKRFQRMHCFKRIKTALKVDIRIVLGGRPGVTISKGVLKESTAISGLVCLLKGTGNIG